MARARNIKPSFFKNDMLGECDMMTRLLFIGLWTLADCSGRLECRPKRLKVELFPYDIDQEITRALATLHTYKFIDLYRVDDVEIIQIVNFNKHQNPHKNEKSFNLPSKPESHIDSASQYLSSNKPDKSSNFSNNHEKNDSDRDVSCLRNDVQGLRNDERGLINTPTKKKKTRAKPATTYQPPDWIPIDKWNDYLQSRKSKRHIKTDKAFANMPPQIQCVVDEGVSLDEVMEGLISYGWASCKIEYYRRGNKNGHPTGGVTNAELAAELMAEEKQAIEGEKV